MRDHISVSQINLYSMCTLKYRFSYIDKIERPFKPAALAFGSSFHAALEWLHRKRMDYGAEVSPEDVIRIFRADWHAWSFQKVRFKKGQDHETLAETGERMILKYLEQMPETKPLDVEVEFKIPLVNPETGEILDMELKGIIDLLEVDDTIVEHKTSARLMDASTVNSNLQLTAYSYAFRCRRNMKKSGIRLDNVTKAKQTKIASFTIERSEKDYVRLFHIADTVIRGIYNGVFFPTPNWMCSDCEYVHHCRNWRGDAETETLRLKEVAA